MILYFGNFYCIAQKKQEFLYEIKCKREYIWQNHSKHMQNSISIPTAALFLGLYPVDRKALDVLLNTQLSWQPSSCNIQDTFYKVSVIMLAWDLMLTLYLRNDELDLMLSLLWANSDSEFSWEEFTIFNWL